MIIFEKDRLNECNDLVVGLYWIGYSVNKDHLETSKAIRIKLESSIQ